MERLTWQYGLFGKVRKTTSEMIAVQKLRALDNLYLILLFLVPGFIIIALPSQGGEGLHMLQVRPVSRTRNALPSRRSGSQ